MSFDRELSLSLVPRYKVNGFVSLLRQQKQYKRVKIIVRNDHVMVERVLENHVTGFFKFNFSWLVTTIGEIELISPCFLIASNSLMTLICSISLEWKEVSKLRRYWASTSAVSSKWLFRPIDPIFMLGSKYCQVLFMNSYVLPLKLTSPLLHVQGWNGLRV